MARTKTEISLGDILRVVKKLPEEDKQKVREAVKPKKNWLKDVYSVFEDVRDEAKRFSESQINRKIHNALREARRE